MTDGGYVSNFNADDYKTKWINSLKIRLRDALEDLKDEENGPEPAGPLGPLRRLHARNLSTFYHDAGGASKFDSHATCLCCLMRPPEQVLKCGHVLCTVSSVSVNLDAGCRAGKELSRPEKVYH